MQSACAKQRRLVLCLPFGPCHLLNAKGLDSTQTCVFAQVAERLRDEALSAVHSSDLLRAVQSADKIAAAKQLQVGLHHVQLHNMLVLGM
jgi:broad specificity phosphatase PhoE